MAATFPPTQAPACTNQGIRRNKVRAVTMPLRWLCSPPSNHAGKAKRTAKNLVLCFSPPEAWVGDFLFCFLLLKHMLSRLCSTETVKPYALNSFACHPEILCSS